MRLTITVTETADGLQEYMQVMSDDQLSINVVLIADEIEIVDGRPPEETKFLTLDNADMGLTEEESAAFMEGIDRPESADA